MHSIQPIGTNQVLYFPETAHEFSRAQTLDFALLVFLYQSNQITFTQLQTRLVYAFLNMSRTANLEKEENEDVIDAVNQIAKLTNAYFQDKRIDNKLTKTIKLDFYMQKLKHIDVNGQLFYGPTDALFNTVYGEYLQLMILLTDFNETADEAILDQIVATIYRPKKPNYNKVKDMVDFDGDIRLKFNPNLTKDYAKTLKALPFHIKYAVFLYVASCHNFIATNTSLSIGGGATIDTSILFEKSEPNSKSIGMIGTIYSLAETKVFGNVKDVAEQNTYDILTFLVNQKNEINKLKSNTNAVTT